MSFGLLRGIGRRKTRARVSLKGERKTSFQYPVCWHHALGRFIVIYRSAYELNQENKDAAAI